MLTPVTEGILDIIKAARARNAPPDEPLLWSRATVPVRPDITVDFNDQVTDRVHGSIDDALAWVNGGPNDELRVLVAISLLGMWRVAASHSAVVDLAHRKVGDKVTATFTPCPFGPDDVDDDNPLRLPGWRPRKERGQ